MFHAFDWATGQQFGDFDAAFPSAVSLVERTAYELDTDASHFGFVVEGEVTLTCSSGTFSVHQGMYFCIPGGATVDSTGRCFVVSRLNWTGLFQIGGPIESTGRLRYIDGCSDTLLISPPVLGDACLNLLHIPAGTHQTQHTHPSLRAGVIVSGHGECITPERTISLSPALPFVIEAEGLHSFHTQDEDLLVIAYHPDSDTGPSHDDHPMVNRTIVNGVSAREIEEIRT